ncbi:phosphoribosylamine--glycine ligase [Helicobacter sp. 13S00401-1]|uniref:phosphoribosylamine--glycine ligase n=1 Tax=Helicobacter sp. 13S00401-1 TaxID=1905758 RepID=UPI000BA6C18A|nr:phosphoribosylamine--glycine ligase [Helicobacter sp. 13S00401-1]PAF51676.1 phosphoribosylamine--glycine ligase [Helicobacter sp. 13S00401-1]
MNILIIGNGGREYSLALALKKDSRVSDIYFSPKSDGASLILGAKSFAYTTFEELLKNIKQHNIDYVIIGPELPCVLGLSDFLRKEGIKVFGIDKENARLEGDKSYMKDFVSKAGVLTAKYFKTTNYEDGANFIESNFKDSDVIVLKASGLCAGKGVLILDSKSEAKDKLKDMLSGALFGEAGKCVVIEEFLKGYELSVFALSDGESFITLPPCQDHKRLLDNDLGPNTGGMGAYSPLPSFLCDEALMQKIESKILKPTFDALKKEGKPYVGVIFAGIMVVNSEPYLLEYNVRFGDPECEILLPSFKTSLLDVLLGVESKSLPKIEFTGDYQVCVVCASKSYPYKTDSKTPMKIDEFDKSLGHIVYASTFVEDGKLYAGSGRVCLAIGSASTLERARLNAYTIASKIEYDGKHIRTDIASQGVAKKSKTT